MKDESIRDRLRRLNRAVASAPSSDVIAASAVPPAPITSGEVDALPAHVAPVTSAEVSETTAIRVDPPRAQVFARLALRAARAAMRVGDARPASAACAPTDAATPALARRDPRGAWSDGTFTPPPRGTVTFGEPRNLEQIQAENGLIRARTTMFTRDHHHGTQPLSAALGVDRALLAERARDDRLIGLDLEHALFLDTETTGLSGGAGTYVFLVGLARFTPNGFEVWQGFLAHPSEEKALLADCAARIAAAPLVVSFFGKSFDRHRLEDKMRLHGIAPPFERVPHLDLYHPLRRIHRGRFDDCRLRTLERELTGVEREDDLPGSFAPAAWFDYLAGRAHRLEGVFQHNLEDVLSLAVLMAQLAGPHVATGAGS